MDILTINDTPGTYPETWYTATATPPGPYPPAGGEIRADACVVGGGYAGLSTALHLAKAGLKVVLVEASRVGSGASGRNGGQVGMGQRVEQLELEAEYGLATAKVLWSFGQEAVDMVRELSAGAEEDCLFTPGVLHVNHRTRYDGHARDYAAHLRGVYGYTGISYLDPVALSRELGASGYSGGTLDMGSGHVHPLRYAFALARAAVASGATIFETSRVTRIDVGAKPKVHTDKAVITADHLVLAMNGYHNNLQPEVSRRVMPINNFIAVTEPLDQGLADKLIPNRYAVADSRFVINYYRLSHDNRMIFGGGESYGYKFPSNVGEKAARPMREIFPQLADARIDYAWGGTLGITMSRLPHFARIGPSTISCAGFSGQGVAMATLAGRMAAEAIGGQAGRFDVMSKLKTPKFPGGLALRQPLLVAAMLWYQLRDRL